MSDASRGYDRQTSWRNDGGFRANPFDPEVQPELFRGVLTRRFIAFLIDLVVLGIPILLGVIFIALFGLLTLGFGWLLFWLVSPLSAIWAILYYGLSLGGPHSATVGMRDHGPAAANLQWRARLLPAGCGTRGALLDLRLGADAVHRAGRPLQPAQSAAARPRAGHGDHQHLQASGAPSRCGLDALERGVRVTLLGPLTLRPVEAMLDQLFDSD